MSSNTPENQESEDLILSFLNQDCFADTDASLSDPKLLANEDNLWDFLSNVPTLDKESLSGGVSPPWSSSSSDDNSGVHDLPSSPHSSKGNSPDFTTPKREEPDADYWQYVNEECLMETAANDAVSSPKGLLENTSLSIDDIPLNFSTAQTANLFPQGIPLSNPQVPLFYPHGLGGLPAFPGLPLFAALPVAPPIQPVSEPPKKKRGRKKREPCPAPSTANLVPLKPLIPVNSQPAMPINFNELIQDVSVPKNVDVPVKKEAIETPIQRVAASSPSQAVVSPKTNNDTSSMSPRKDTPSVEAATTAINKRQERLIKNRAAALLSRKRKREHMTNLETTNEALVHENDELKSQVQELETQLQTVSYERDQAQEECIQLRKMLEEFSVPKEPLPLEDISNETSIEIENMDVDLESNYITVSESNEIIKLEDKRLSKPKTTGVVLMIIFFSFALFSLPMTNYQSTLGSNYGSRAIMSASIFSPSLKVETPAARIVDVESVPVSKVKQRPVKRSIPNENEGWKCPINGTESPRPESRDEATQAIHSWLSSGQFVNKSKVKPVQSESDEQVSMAVATFREPQQNILPLFNHAYLYCPSLEHFFTKQNESDRQPLNQRPRISLLTPVGGIFSPPWVDGSTDRKYLKIDVEVTGSGLVDTGDSWMFPGLKRAPTYGGTIDA